MIHFICPKCGNPVRAKDEMVGMKGRCSICTQLIRIPSTADKDARLSSVLQEKEQRRSEMLDYNKRLDRTIVLYLSAAYAAIGLETAGKLDLSALRTQDHYVWLAFGFIFLNACILLHGISQSAWCMSIAKFIHIKLETELLQSAGVPAPNQDQLKTGELADVEFLGFDDWEKEIKGVANASRGLIAPLWMLLLLASSVCSLMFVNVPRFLESYWNKDFPVAYLPLCAIALLILLHLQIFIHLIRLGIFVKYYHASRVSFSTADSIILWVLPVLFTGGLVSAAYFAAINHQ
jgi:hypothetical protein